MRALNYTLSPTRISNTKPKTKTYKLSDGGGLFVEIHPGGLKSWRYQYRVGGVRNTVTIGKYPRRERRGAGGGGRIGRIGGEGDSAHGRDD